MNQQTRRYRIGKGIRRKRNGNLTTVHKDKGGEDVDSNSTKTDNNTKLQPFKQEMIEINYN